MVFLVCISINKNKKYVKKISINYTQFRKKDVYNCVDNCVYNVENCVEKSENSVKIMLINEKKLFTKVRLQIIWCCDLINLREDSMLGTTKYERRAELHTVLCF